MFVPRTAGLCPGPATVAHQPGQQPRSAQRVPVLLGGAGGLRQEGKSVEGVGIFRFLFFFHM